MENIFIDFLPPWVETGLQPAFYDKESGTVLQQTARMYAKVNELVKGYHQQSQTINEYITKFNQLHDYVYNYFDNLDVQEEINNKLDDMAESGELAEIIAQFLGLGSVYGFDTISDMASSTYLIDGSICKTLGKTNAMTGDGNYYRVRERTNADEPDGVNLVVLTGTVNLVAEIVPDYYINQLTNSLSTTNSNVSSIDTRVTKLEGKKHLVVIGDSFSTTTYNPVETAWYTIVGNRLNLTVHNYAKDSAGYVHIGSNNSTFSTEVDEAINDTSFNNNDVEYVIVYGGLNDMNVNDASGIYSAGPALFTKISSNFQNAKIICLGINTWRGGLWQNSSNNFTSMNYWYGLKANCIFSGVCFINCMYWLLTNDDRYYNLTNAHPNEDGNKVFATNLLSLMLGGNNVLYDAAPFRATATTGSGDVTISYNSNCLKVTGTATTVNGTCVIPVPKKVFGTFQTGNTIIGIAANKKCCYITRNTSEFTVHADTPDSTYYFSYVEPYS